MNFTQPTVLYVPSSAQTRFLQATDTPLKQKPKGCAHKTQSGAQQQGIATLLKHFVWVCVHAGREPLPSRSQYWSPAAYSKYCKFSETEM